MDQTIGTSANKMVEIKTPANSGKVFVTKGAYNLLTAMKNSNSTLKYIFI